MAASEIVIQMQGGGVVDFLAVLHRNKHERDAENTAYKTDVPARSWSRTTPLPAAISSVYLRGRGCSTPLYCRFRMRSRSRWPSETVHRFNLVDRSVPSVSSGPWYGRFLLRLRGGCLGASGGGVGGRLCTVKSNKDMMSELCSWTACKVSHG